jgi:hypothetical protein
MNYPYQALFLDIRSAKKRLETMLDSTSDAGPDASHTEIRIEEYCSSECLFPQEFDNCSTIARARLRFTTNGFV